MVSGNMITFPVADDNASNNKHASIDLGENKQKIINAITNLIEAGISEEELLKLVEVIPSFKMKDVIAEVKFKAKLEHKKQSSKNNPNSNENNKNDDERKEKCKKKPTVLIKRKTLSRRHSWDAKRNTLISSSPSKNGKVQQKHRMEHQRTIEGIAEFVNSHELFKFNTFI